MTIGLGIPRLDVDAVQDADKILRAIAQDAVEAEAVFRRENLARVRRADGRERVGEKDSALERACAAPELEQPRMVQLAAQTDPRQLRGIEQSLEREVVNREHAPHAFERGIAAKDGPEVDRRERPLPIVRVQDRQAASALDSQA